MGSLRGEVRDTVFWTQLAPMDPLQGTAEPLSQDGGASRKTNLRKGKNHCTGSEEKSVRNSPVSNNVSEG